MKPDPSKKTPLLGREARKRVSLVSLILLFASTSCSLVLLSACSSSSTTPRVVTLEASWAEYYTSLKDLKQHTDIAVLGSISSIAPAVKPADGGPVYSMVTVTVNRVLWKHNQSTSPSAITFQQTGGTYKNVTYQISDDPLFHIGDQTILFFTEYSPGKYRVSGGPTGHFSVENGMVRPIVSDGAQLPASTDVSHFVTALQSS